MNAFALYIYIWIWLGAKWVDICALDGMAGRTEDRCFRLMVVVMRVVAHCGQMKWSGLCVCGIGRGRCLELR